MDGSSFFTGVIVTLIAETIIVGIYLMGFNHGKWDSK